MANGLFQHLEALKNIISQYNPMNYIPGIYSDAQTVYEREDSAYQRMVADMKKAGLNPWTGISSGGLATSSQTPSLDSLTSLMSYLSYELDKQNSKNLRSYRNWNIGFKFQQTLNDTAQAVSNIISSIKGAK